MLEGSFFTSDTAERTGSRLSGAITFNAAHAIFSGHFPGQPVVPGVCMLEVIRELLETAAGKKLLLRRAQQVKYLAPIDPRLTPEVQFDIDFHEEGPGYTVNARLFRDEVQFLKFKGVMERK